MGKTLKNKLIGFGAGTLATIFGILPNYLSAQEIKTIPTA